MSLSARAFTIGQERDLPLVHGRDRRAVPRYERILGLLADAELTREDIW
jgi:hypothetical protein